MNKNIEINLLINSTSNNDLSIYLFIMSPRAYFGPVGRDCKLQRLQ